MIIMKSSCIGEHVSQVQTSVDLVQVAFSAVTIIYNNVSIKIRFNIITTLQ